jgi:hypothetical protein
MREERKEEEMMMDMVGLHVGDNKLIMMTLMMDIAGIVEMVSYLNACFQHSLFC